MKALQHSAGTGSASHSSLTFTCCLDLLASDASLPSDGFLLLWEKFLRTAIHNQAVIGWLSAVEQPSEILNFESAPGLHRSAGAGLGIIWESFGQRGSKMGSTVWQRAASLAHRAGDESAIRYLTRSAVLTLRSYCRALDKSGKEVPSANEVLMSIPAPLEQHPEADHIKEVAAEVIAHIDARIGGLMSALLDDGVAFPSKDNPDVQFALFVIASGSFWADGAPVTAASWAAKTGRSVSAVQEAFARRGYLTHALGKSRKHKTAKAFDKAAAEKRSAAIDQLRQWLRPLLQEAPSTATRAMEFLRRRFSPFMPAPLLDA